MLIMIIVEIYGGFEMQRKKNGLKNARAKSFIFFFSLSSLTLSRRGKTMWHNESHFFGVRQKQTISFFFIIQMI